MLQVFRDSGFAPEGGRSQGCCLAYWRDSCIFWTSSKQPFTCQSTCESELLVTVESANMAESFRTLGVELLQGIVPRCVVRNDNAAAVILASSEAANWRTRHLKIRASALRERIESHEWEVRHIPGESNPSDIGTKVLPVYRKDSVAPGARWYGACQFVGPGLCQVKRAAAALYAVIPSTCTGVTGASRVEGDDSVEGFGVKDGGSVESSRVDWAMWLLLVV